MSYFQTKNLDYVLKKIVGGGTPSKAKEEYWNGDIPWLSVKDMKDDTYRLEKTQDTITMSGVENSSTNIIPKGTIIVSTRMGLGRCLINSIDMAINQDLKALIINEELVDRNYLFYVLKSKAEEIEAMGSGTTVKGIRLDDLKSIEINLPPLKTQQKIASLLSNYDKLIENNTQRIKLLESMAEELYKEWFVRLRFPGHEDIEIVDGVPEGWERNVISSFGKIVTGKTPSTKNSDNFGGDIPFIKTPDFKQGIYLIDNEETLSRKGADSQKSQYIPKNSICVSCIGTVGEIGISIKTSQSNQQINSIVLNDERYLEYLYLTIKYIKPLLEMFASSGATMGNLSKSKFSNMKVIKPDFSVVEKYHLFIEPIFSEIKILQQKNQTLKQTRDLLLPRLMSGKLNVEDLDII